MAAPRVPQKWRPTLAMIVLAVLLTVLVLPAAIVVWFRALDNTTSAMGPIEIGARKVAEAVEQGRQPIAVGDDVIEEALALLAAHLRIAQQLRRAADRRHRGPGPPRTDRGREGAFRLG